MSGLAQSLFHPASLEARKGPGGQDRRAIWIQLEQWNLLTSRPTTKGTQIENPTNGLTWTWHIHAQCWEVWLSNSLPSFHVGNFSTCRSFYPWKWWVEFCFLPPTILTLWQLSMDKRKPKGNELGNIVATSLKVESVSQQVPGASSRGHYEKHTGFCWSEFGFSWIF